MHSTLMRVLMAAYLAICSPAICCCAIKSTFGGAAVAAMTDSESGAAERSCCSNQQHSRFTVSNCCIAAAAARHAQPFSSHPDDGGCRCHEKSSDLYRLDTGRRVSIPSVSDLVVPIFMVAAAPVLAFRDSPVARRDPAQRTHPPPDTLFAQRCLLLI